MLRGRTLGNSATALYRHLCLRHKEHYLGQSTLYLSVLRNFVTQNTDPSSLIAALPQMVPVPSPSWLLSVYAREVLTRLPELKARVTSVYGSILKMDSTKKVTPDLVLHFALFFFTYCKIKMFCSFNNDNISYHVLGHQEASWPCCWNCCLGDRCGERNWTSPHVCPHRRRGKGPATHVFRTCRSLPPSWRSSSASPLCGPGLLQDRR